jgi:hypothetical protein
MDLDLELKPDPQRDKMLDPDPVQLNYRPRYTNYNTKLYQYYNLNNQRPQNYFCKIMYPNITNP